MGSDVILETEDLTKEFAGFIAVNGVSLRVMRRTIHALIGPNGAGKTTCFNLLTKFLSPTRGRIVFNGHDITAMQPADVARLGLVRSFQISAVFPHLTVLENVRIALQRLRGSSFDFWRSTAVLDQYNERALELIADVGLAEFADWLAVELPYGRKRALEIATTLALDPEMLLLDEPTAGMGHEDIDRIAQLIKRVAADRTVLMVEHNLSVVADLSDPITVLTRGRVLAEGDYADGVEQSGGARSLYGSGPCLTRALPCSRSGTCRPGTANRTSCTASSFRRARRRGGDAARPQRRRQDHDAEVDHGHGRPAHRLGALRGPGADRPLVRADRARRHRALPGGARHLRQPQCRGKSAAAAGDPAGRPVARTHLRPVSQSQGAAGASQGTKLSGGEQQMLAIGRILRTGARLLLLDEPTEGLAPVIIQQIGKTIRALKEQGFTILLVEQNFRFAATVADRYYVMEHGRIIDQFANADLDANLEKLHDYLGV